MKKLWDLKKGFGNLELEGQGHGIIMRVTRLLLPGPFYTIQTKTDKTFWRAVYMRKYGIWKKGRIKKQRHWSNFQYSFQPLLQVCPAFPTISPSLQKKFFKAIKVMWGCFVQHNSIDPQKFFFIYDVNQISLRLCL